MKLSSTKELNRAQHEQLMLLWNNEYPEQLAYHDVSAFRSYLSGLANTTHYLLTDEPESMPSPIGAKTQASHPYGLNNILGWAFTFTRAGERWFAIILDSRAQRQGLGTLLLNRIKEQEQILNGWVTDHNRYIKKDKTPYFSPLAFYLKNDFTVCAAERFETEKLSAVKIQWSTGHGNTP